MVVGSYGTNLSDTAPAASCTQPTKIVSDGTRYFYLPWLSTKPCIKVHCQWEDISFRIDTINMLESVVDKLVSP